ncbi:MAG: hypothetical protein IIT58_09065, partial [Treponema sp.]|nr:hypothetical protein [Treponema sp.]
RLDSFRDQRGFSPTAGRDDGGIGKRHEVAHQMGSFVRPVGEINVFNNLSVCKGYVHLLKFSANVIK